MDSAGKMFSDSPSSGGRTRRSLLQALTTAPALFMPPAQAGMLSEMHARFDAEPAILRRTREGRRLSLHRCDRAEGFFPDRIPSIAAEWRDFLYSAGITAQLALSAHLLDIGFADEWCARHIGLRVERSLAYANATGFGHDCPDMERLAAVLTPYNKWNRPRLFGEPVPDDGGFTPAHVQALLRTLLDRVYAVTGHRNIPRQPDRRRRARAYSVSESLGR